MNLLKAKETCGDNSPRVFKPKNKKAISGGNVFYASIVALPLLQFIVFYVVVNFNSFLMAFQSYDNSTGKAVIGFTFDNFAYFFDKIVFDDLWLCIKNSLLYLALNIVICIPVSLLFSYYIYKKFLLSELFKVILFLPSIVCSTAMVIFYKYFVNQGLASLLGGSVIGPVYNEKQQVEDRRRERNQNFHSCNNSADLGNDSIDYRHIFGMVCNQSGIFVHVLRI